MLESATDVPPGLHRRPWLDLYEPCDGRLLATRISSFGSEENAGDAEDGSLLPFEVWLAIASHLSLAEFAAVCRLGGTCRTLRPLGRHPVLWRRLCLLAFQNHGFLPSDGQLRKFRWSWRTMFRERLRLRFDGFYYLATTKLLVGLNEGRGMKEADKDFYKPGGRWVTSYRVLRFWPDGRMFTFLFAWQTPAEARRALSLVTPDRPKSLHQHAKGACWGAYDLREHDVPTTSFAAAGDAVGGAAAAVGTAAAAAADTEGPVTSLTASVLLQHENYPNMVPATVRYVLELRGKTRPPPESAVLSSVVIPGAPGGGAGGASTAIGAPGSNSSLYMMAHAIETVARGEHDVKSLPVPTAGPFVFVAFDQGRGARAR
jgi:hypothetical protein